MAQSNWTRGVLAISCVIVLFNVVGCGEDRAKVKAQRAAAEMFALDDAAFTQFLHSIGKERAQGEERDQLRAEWRRKTLFAREAMSAGMDSDEGYQTALRQFQRDMLAQRYVDNMLRERATNVVLKPQYAVNKNEFAVPEVHLSGIFISEKPEGGDLAKDAQDLLTQLNAGADFGALAKEFSSDGTTSARGGDMGWLPTDVAVQRFGESVKNEEPGKVLGPIAVPHGAYLVKVMDPPRTRVPEFADVRRQLLEQKRAQLVVELEKELRAKMSEIQ